MAHYDLDTTQFRWTAKRTTAAMLLAEGLTHLEVGERVGASRKSIANWLAVPEFAQEVDRLSVMVAAASRAYRLRLANRAISQILARGEGGGRMTDKDLLDWLKYAQGETDGVKLDLLTLLEGRGDSDGSQLSQTVDVTPLLLANGYEDEAEGEAKTDGLEGNGQNS